MIKILIGLFLAVILSPSLIWFGQSQHSEEKFLRSKEVSSEAVQNGYVSVVGASIPDTTLNCPLIKVDEVEKPCLFVDQETFEYKTSSSVLCGDTLSSSYRVIKQVENRCSETGGNCEACYQVEKDDWVSVERKVTHVPFKVGQYTISPTEKTNFIDELQGEYFVSSTGERRLGTEIPALGDKNYKFIYFPKPESILVAGLSLDGKIESGGDNGIFVVSNKLREATALALKSEDKIAGKILSIFSLFLMMLGFAFMVSPLTTWIRHVFGVALPGLDRLLSRGASWLIYLAAGVVGGVFWLILFLLVFLVKNILIAGILAAVIGLIFAVVVRSGGLEAMKKKIKK
ncbi:MAG: hypothetical protein WC702_00305 [Patescibacteria group bacterium]|jgi:hypothetical protein